MALTKYATPKQYVEEGISDWLFHMKTASKVIARFPAALEAPSFERNAIDFAETLAGRGVLSVKKQKRGAKMIVSIHRVAA